MKIMSQKEIPKQNNISGEKFKPPFCYYCGREVDCEHEGYERVAHSDCIKKNSDDELSWEEII